MKPVTVPFFISHQGCPHTCIFCDQRTISGADGALPAAADIRAKVGLWRSTACGRPLEVAFFGGSFSALPETVQSALLDPLQELLNDGIVDSVRISTRPDYVDDARVEWLSARGVHTIELGVQSLDDTVLSASGRGHSVADSLSAIRCVKMRGLRAGVQLMPGLPGETTLSAVTSLDRAIAAGADFIRIYPTIVLQGTGLAQQYLAGEFVPLSLENGISLCALLLQRALRAGTDVIRIGLQADAGLNSENVLAGCWHPALGQLVRSRLYADLIERVVPYGATVMVHCHPTRLSDVVGMKQSNLLQQRRRGVLMRVVPDSTVMQDEIKVQTEEAKVIYSILRDITYSIHEV